MDHAVLAALFLQLARTDEAGLRPVVLLCEIKFSRKQSRNIDRFKRLIRSGLPLSVAGRTAGVFGVVDAELLKAGETSGKSGEIYRRLAAHYAKKSRQERKIKARMIMPFFVLAAALLIQPLPDLARGELTVESYLLRALGSLLAVVLILLASRRSVYWLTEGPLGFLGLGRAVYALQLVLPPIRSWLKRRWLSDFVETLGLLLESGIPAVSALTVAAGAVDNPLFRKKILLAESELSQGRSLAEALNRTGAFERRIVDLVKTAEASGTLPKSLRHFAAIESESLDLRDDFLAEWLPRLFYFLIAGWMAFSLLSDPAAVIPHIRPNGV
ncbi:MAG: type II secretion system F family protein [Gammaproteobacteria bacterium]